MIYFNRELHLVAIPEGLPTSEHFKIVESQLSSPTAGHFLIRNKFLSVDPYMRPRLSNGMTVRNRPLDGGAIGEVIESGHPEFPVGSIVLHSMGFREYALSMGVNVVKVDIRSEPVSAHLGPLGMTGLTAYAGMLVVAAIKDEERVFVSAAAGAVGSVAAQIAKIRKCWVVGTAGSDSKCAWLRDVAKLDAVINYKTTILRKALKECAVDGIDVFFDNVGGDHLNAALPRMRMRGRIAMCGMISSYNNKGAISEGITTLSSMMYNRLSMQGFIQSDYEYLRPQFLDDMRGWLADGLIHAEETIFDGLNKAPAALIGLFTGQNLGKMLVRL